MNLEWKKRLTNPWFWVGMVGVVLTATGANPEMFTSWQVLCDEVKALFANPYLLATGISGSAGGTDRPDYQRDF